MQKNSTCQRQLSGVLPETWGVMSRFGAAQSGLLASGSSVVTSSIADRGRRPPGRGRARPRPTAPARHVHEDGARLHSRELGLADQPVRAGVGRGAQDHEVAAAEQFGKIGRRQQLVERFGRAEQRAPLRRPHLHAEAPAEAASSRPTALHHDAEALVAEHMRLERVGVEPTPLALAISQPGRFRASMIIAASAYSAIAVA